MAMTAKLLRSSGLAWATLAAVIPVAASGLSAAEPGKPALVINDPFAAPLWRIDVDQSESYVVAGSPAKAAAVFPIDDPERVELLRVPHREEEMQRAHAVAMSPDGRLVAYSVPPLRDGNGIAKTGTALVYVIERDTKRILRQIAADVPTRPQALRFSPDGTHLAATLSDGCGLRVWRTSDWGLAFSDDDAYGNGPCAGAAPGVDIDKEPDTPGLAYGRDTWGQVWIVTSGDTGVRAYRQSGEAIALAVRKTAAEIGLERPEGVAFSPSGEQIAVGDARRRGQGGKVRLAVAMLDVATLDPARAPLGIPDDALLSTALLDLTRTPAADQMSLNRVAWGSTDEGEFIVAGGVLWCQVASPSIVMSPPENAALDVCMVRWSLGPEASEDSEVRLIRAGVDRIMDIAVLPRRQAILYATQQRVAAVAFDGSPYASTPGAPFSETARALDLRDRPINAAEGSWLGFHISDDASVVYVEDYRGTRAAPIGLKFDVNQLKLERLSTPPQDLSPANRDPFIIDATANWWNQVMKPPLVYGKALAPLAGIKDTYRVVALAPEQRAIIGSSNFVRLVDYGGDTPVVGCELRVAAEAYRGAVSADGTLAVIGHGDGTLRWYRIAAGDGGSCALEPLLAVHIRQTEWGRDEWTWTAWIPATGRFASDGRARGVLGWQTTGSDGQVSLVRFADLLKFYAPDHVKLALKTAKPETAAVASLEMSIRESADAARLMLLAPGDGEDAETPTIRFDLKVTGHGSWPKTLQVVVDGSVQASAVIAGQDIASAAPVEIATAGLAQIDVTLPPAARTRHRLIPVCFRVEQAQACRTINWTGAIEAAPPRTLRAVVAGFSGYDDPELELRYAQNDAIDLVKLFVADYEARAVKKTSALAPDFENVHVDLFVAPTTERARDELAALARTGVVTLHNPDLQSLRKVLADLGSATRRADGAASDLLIFYFSGHGLLNPYRRSEGLTAFLAPTIDGMSKEALEKHALASDELIRSLEAASGEKVVILDACRTGSTGEASQAFDPAAVSLEFERQLLSADLFFSAAPGQASLDQGQYAFDMTRPEAERGNGLFTYAVLKSLTSPGSPALPNSPRKVEVFDLDRDVRGFFDPRNAESAAQKLIALLQSRGMSVSLQNPIFIPARRRPGATTVIRTVEVARP